MTKGSSQEHPIMGVAVIVTKDDLILIGYDGHKKKYSFPGGHWEGEENMESLENGAARELFEETGGFSGIANAGVKCKNFKELYNHVFLREDEKRWYKSVGFTAEYESGDAGDDPSEERFGWTFMKPEDAMKLDLFEPVRIGLRYFLENNQTKGIDKML